MTFEISHNTFHDITYGFFVAWVVFGDRTPQKNAYRSGQISLNGK